MKRIFRRNTGKIIGFFLGLLLTNNIIATSLLILLAHFLWDYKESQHNINDEDLDEQLYSKTDNKIKFITYMLIYIYKNNKEILFKITDDIKQRFIEKLNFDINDILSIDSIISKNINRTINIDEIISALNYYLTYSEKINLLNSILDLINNNSNNDIKKNMVYIIENFNINNYDFKLIFNRYNKDDIEKYYKLLNIPNNSSVQDIKKSYRKIVSELHPDKAKDNYDKKKFQEIVEAYNNLIKLKSS